MVVKYAILLCPAAPRRGKSWSHKSGNPLLVNTPQSIVLGKAARGWRGKDAVRLAESMKRTGRRGCISSPCVMPGLSKSGIWLATGELGDSSAAGAWDKDAYDSEREGETVLCEGPAPACSHGDPEEPVV